VPDGFKQSVKKRPRIGEINLVEEAGKYDPDPEIRKAGVLTDDFSPANSLLNQER
jgi:hypothetical protein